VERVTVGLAWPSSRETKTTFRPLANRSEAKRCRREWSERRQVPPASPRPPKRDPKRLADVALVDAAAERVGEGEVVY